VPRHYFQEALEQLKKDEDNEKGKQTITEREIVDIFKQTAISEIATTLQIDGVEVMEARTYYDTTSIIFSFTIEINKKRVELDCTLSYYPERDLRIKLSINSYCLMDCTGDMEYDIWATPLVTEKDLAKWEKKNEHKIVLEFPQELSWLITAVAALTTASVGAPFNVPNFKEILEKAHLYEVR